MMAALAVRSSMGFILDVTEISRLRTRTYLVLSFLSLLSSFFTSDVLRRIIAFVVRIDWGRYLSLIIALNTIMSSINNAQQLPTTQEELLILFSTFYPFRTIFILASESSSFSNL